MTEPVSAGAQAGITARGLGFSYFPGEWVFRGLDLSLRPGAVHAVLGLNGCGKTTLLRLILGLLKPVEGTLATPGDIAFVPQLFQAVFSFTALDMVLMGRARKIGLFSRPSKRDEELSLSVMDKIGVANLANRPFTELSGGQRQLIILARALVSEARTLVLDEPASALDLKNQVKLIRRLKQLCVEDHLTIIFSTHMPQHALAVADEVLLMPSGRPAMGGPTPAVLTEENLTTLFGTEVRLLSYQRGGQTSRAFVTVFDE